MAKGKGSIKGWITKNGVHIPIYGNYTVREGHEPTAKGAKFKGGKKKKVDTSTTMGKTTKELEDNLKKKGLVLEAADKADMAHKDFNDEKVTLYDNDGNVYKGTYNRYYNGDKEIVNIEKDRSAEKVQAGQVEGKGDFAKHEDYTKNAGQKKKWQDISKALGDYDANNDKYADRDWNKDVEDSKRYGYSEQTEEGKKPVTKAEEEKQARQSFRDKKAQEQGFADDASMRSYNEETGVNAETWKSQTEEEKKPSGQHLANVRKGDFKGYNREAKIEQQINDRFKTKREWDEIAKNAGYKDSNDPEFQKNADDIVAKNKQANSKATPESYAQSKGKSIRDIAQEVNNNDAARATANQLMKDGRTYEEAAALAHQQHFKEQTSSTSDLRSRIQAQAEQADVHRQRTSVKKVQSPRTPKLVAPTEEMKKAMGIDGDYGTHNVSAAKETMRRYKTESPLYAEDKVRRYAKMAQEEKAKAQSIADAISGVTGIANSGSIQNMSPSGLKSAYAEATGARKTKLANELRKRGYQFTGGRWTKKKS